MIELRCMLLKPDYGDDEHSDDKGTNSTERKNTRDEDREISACPN